MSRVEAPLRVVTYNMHKGIGGIDRRYRLERIVEVLGHCRPDIVFLQEVDEGVPRSRRDRQVEELASATGLPYWAFQPNVKLREGHYGNAILSRFPLSDVMHCDLTIPLKKRRRALLCHAKVVEGGHRRTLLLVNTHLGLSGFERNAQIKRLLQARLLQRTHRSTPVILGGDFNDVWATLGSKYLEPVGFDSAGKKVKTFPAFYPVRPLDRLFFRGELRLDHAYASRTKLAAEASDHLPLVGVFGIVVGGHQDGDAAAGHHDRRESR